VYHDYQNGTVKRYKKIMPTCKEICKRFRASKPYGTRRYETGQKLCRYCGIFIKFNGFQCPCCGCKLRVTPKSAKYRKLLRTAKGIDY